MKRISSIGALDIAALFLLAGCATVAATPAENHAADGRNVALGQTVTVDGPQVKPVAVLEDSRCPAKVQCIWAGQVRLKMLWVRPSGNEAFEVTLGKPVSLADGKFTLTGVRPERQADKAIKPADYRFSFEFAGGL